MIVSRSLPQVNHTSFFLPSISEKNVSEKIDTEEEHEVKTKKIKRPGTS